MNIRKSRPPKIYKKYIMIIADEIRVDRDQLENELSKLRKLSLLNGRTLKQFRWDIYSRMWVDYFYNWDFGIGDKDFERFENSTFYNNPTNDREYSQQMGQFILSKVRFNG